MSQSLFTPLERRILAVLRLCPLYGYNSVFRDLQVASEPCSEADYAVAIDGLHARGLVLFENLAPAPARGGTLNLLSDLDQLAALLAAGMSLQRGRPSALAA
jgi:hypothetical protein